MGRRWLILCWSILLLLAAGLVLPGVEAQTRKFYGGLPDPRSPKSQYYNALSRGDLGAVIKFLNEGMSPNDRGIYPLVVAIRGGHLAMVNLLLAEGANPNMPAVGGLTPLWVAAQKGDLAIVQVLLAKGAEVNANNPLGEAAERGHLPVVQALLAKGADVNVKDGSGRTAYIRAEENGHDRICQVLKQAGAQVDTDYSEAAFLRAAAVGDFARVKDFLAKGMNPNAKDSRGKTALMWAVEKGRLQVVQALLAKGADVNANNPLGEAASRGHLPVVQALLAKGADVNAKDGSGKTAYIRAEEHGHDRICQVLKQAGAQVDADYSEAGFLRAAAVGDLARVKDFLAKGVNPNARDSWGRTALMRAAEKGRLQVVQALLAKGAEVNAQDRWEGKTALMLAQENNHAAVVKALQQAGAREGRGDGGRGQGPKGFTFPPPPSRIN